MDKGQKIEIIICESCGRKNKSYKKEAVFFKCACGKILRNQLITVKPIERLKL